MSATQIRTVGTTATFASVIKRSVITLSDNRTVTLIIDANQAASSGTDVTGVAKICLYVSTDTTRTAHTLAANFTPSVAPCSATRAARASIGRGSDNKIWVAWQGVDNGLYVSSWTYAAGVLTPVSTETLVAASGTVDRYRAVDISVGNTNQILVAAYNTAATSAATHVFLRNTANNWIQVVSSSTLGAAARVGSEDISVMWRADVGTSGTHRFLLYQTKVSTTADFGDRIREYAVDVATTTASSATTSGTWLSDAAFQNQAAGTRRAMISQVSNTIWMLAGVIGSAAPKFFATKLTTNAYSTPVINTAGYVSTTALANFFQIDNSYNPRTSFTVVYRDSRVLFVFISYGAGLAPRIVREVSMQWPDVATASAKPTIDLVPRPSDSGFYGDGGPIAVYGGEIKTTTAGTTAFAYLAIYGPSGNTLSSTIPRRARFVAEDVYDAPALLSPIAVEPTARPTYRVSVNNANLQPNLYGKVEINVATNSTFTTGLITFQEDDKNFRYFGTKDGLSGSALTVSVPTPGPGQALTQGAWFWRARVISDKGTIGAWSTTGTFTVSHPPTSIPIFPTASSVIPYTSANSYNFAWNRSDTDPNDSQTAYRIIVRRLDTLANVLDTGFVASSVTSATASLDFQALGLIESPLDWSVQLKDADSVTGPASTPVQFIVGYQPAIAILSPNPTDPVTTAMPTISWSTTPYGSRTQKAFRISIYNNVNPNLIATNRSFESGSLTGYASAGGTAAATSAQAHSGAFSGSMTPDGTTVTPNFSLSANITGIVPGKNYTAEFWIRPNGSVAKPPVVGFNWYDSGGVFISNTGNFFQTNPIISAWQKVSSTAQAPVGAVQANLFFGRGFTPAVGDTFNVDDVGLFVASAYDTDPIFSTGWVASTNTNYTPPLNVMVNSSAYRIVLEVQDSAGLYSIQDVAVTTNWVEPALASAQTAVAFDDFKVRVAWTNAAQDSDFISYRVYRKYMQVADVSLDIDDTANTWFLVYETDAIQSSYTFDDYLVPLNKQVQYVVVQLADRFGSLIESNITSSMSVTLVGERYFFVPSIPVGAIASFESSGITGDSFSRDVEQEVLHVIGRGRQVQIGDDLGYSGTLTVKLRNPATARRDREFFELISATYNKVYVKSPFGDVILIALQSVQTARQPGYGGYSDFSDLSIPYTQIYDEPLLMRQV